VIWYRWTSKYKFFSFRNINLKLAGSRASLDVLKFLSHRNWTLLRNKYSSIVSKFNYTVVL